MGHDRIVRWFANMLFSETLRLVALRAIGLTGAHMECCGKAAAFVQRRRLAVKGHYRIVRWCVNMLFSETLRLVALRAIGLTRAHMECCGKAAAFVQRRRLAVMGHDRIVRWCANMLFSSTLRLVALRAIGSTGARPSAECSDDVWR